MNIKLNINKKKYIASNQLQQAESKLKDEIHEEVENQLAASDQKVQQATDIVHGIDDKIKAMQPIIFSHKSAVHIENEKLIEQQQKLIQQQQNAKEAELKLVSISGQDKQLNSQRAAAKKSEQDIKKEQTQIRAEIAKKLNWAIAEIVTNYANVQIASANVAAAKRVATLTVTHCEAMYSAMGVKKNKSISWNEVEAITYEDIDQRVPALVAKINKKIGKVVLGVKKNHVGKCFGIKSLIKPDALYSKYSKRKVREMLRRLATRTLAEAATLGRSLGQQMGGGTPGGDENDEGILHYLSFKTYKMEEMYIKT